MHRAALRPFLIVLGGLAAASLLIGCSRMPTPPESCAAGDPCGEGLVCDRAKDLCVPGGDGGLGFTDGWIAGHDGARGQDARRGDGAARVDGASRPPDQGSRSDGSIVVPDRAVPPPPDARVCPPTKPNWCPGGCVNLQNDQHNCGVCGRRCGNNAICFKGRCATIIDPKE
ncbi:MAG: hypothetical protein IT371_27015 [Deltaproteobacteria bacterium]|nr:hypothetical protein [Deltaproteobacteria bacterium]